MNIVKNAVIRHTQGKMRLSPKCPKHVNTDTYAISGTWNIHKSRFCVCLRTAKPTTKDPKLLVHLDTSSMANTCCKRDTQFFVSNPTW